MSKVDHEINSYNSLILNQTNKNNLKFSKTYSSTKLLNPADIASLKNNTKLLSDKIDNNNPQPETGINMTNNLVSFINEEPNNENSSKNTLKKSQNKIDPIEEKISDNAKNETLNYAHDNISYGILFN